MSETTSHRSAKDFCAGHRRSAGRVHLPVAPRALARIRFSPDQPLPRALTPEQALNWLDYLAAQGESIQVVNLSGPGDPLATPDLTLETLAGLRSNYPGLSICLTTLGLGAGDLAERLAGFGLAHVSILMDAVDPKTCQKLYAWIRPGTRTLPLSQAAVQLVEGQADAISAFTRAGITVLIKTTLYPGINSEDVVEIAQKAAGLGASEMKLFPFLAKDEDQPRPAGTAGPRELAELAKQAAEYLTANFVDLEQCTDVLEFDFADPAHSGAALPKPSKKRPHLAVCSSDGFEVDLHLGQAPRYLIYGPKDGPVVLIDMRPAPEPGGGDTRWQQTAFALSDCFAVLCAAAGEAPSRILPEKGLAVLAQEGNVEGLVDVLYGGGKKGRKK